MAALTGRLLSLAMSLLALLASATAAAQAVLPEQSDISFTSRQMGVPVEGRFKRWSAAIRFDPRSPQAAQISLSIDTGSLAFGAAETEAEAARPGWFNVAKFPQATFVSSAVRAVGNSTLRFEMAGKLTLKGTTRELVVPVTLAAAPAGLARASGSFTLRRLDFAIGDGDWNDPSLVADEVQVRFRLMLSGLALP